MFCLSVDRPSIWFTNLSFSGFIPEMKIFSAAPSFKFTGSDSQGVEIPDTQMPYNFDKHKWNDGAISVGEAFSRIEKTMYPFKEVRQPTMCFLITNIKQYHLCVDSLFELPWSFQDSSGAGQVGAFHNALGGFGRPVLLRFGTDTPGWSPGVFVRYVSPQREICIHLGSG